MVRCRPPWTGVVLAFCVVNFYSPGPVSGTEIGVSAQGKFTFRGGDDEAFHLNAMNRGDNPFSPFNVLLLTQARINGNTDLFLEIPIDANASSSQLLTYLRPFVRISSISGQPWLNMQAGKLPTLFGTYGERTISTDSGLMGIPLLYHYPTAVTGWSIPASADHFFEAGVRGEGNGVPIVYDACWDTGMEVFGAENGFQYTAAATHGTISRPAAQGENYNDGYQFLGRAGYEVTEGPLFGLRLGASGAFGPYLNSTVIDNPDFPADASPEDFLNTALGLDLSYARGPWRFFGEMGRIGFEVPNVDPTLYVTSYYLELIRNLGPSWSLALRQEGALFSELTSTTGSTENWDHDLWRWEATMNYRFRPGTRFRFGYQTTRFPDAPELDADLFAVQLQVWTR